MSDGLRVYIAGPYSHFDVALNVREAVRAGLDVLKAGHVPFIPHLYHFAHLLEPQPYDSWMTLDLQWLAACHCLVRLHGHSPGADREVERAKALGLPVYLDLAACLAALPPVRHGKETNDDRCRRRATGA